MLRAIRRRASETAPLSSIKGAPALAAVAPYLAALPGGTPVNVNTASPAVLAALVDGLNPDQWSAFVDGRVLANGASRVAVIGYSGAEGADMAHQGSPSSSLEGMATAAALAS